MNSNINVVLCQNSANNILVERELHKLDFTVGIERINSLKDLIKVLNKDKISLIISDYNFNQIDVLEIINLLKISHRSIPLIIFSEKADEEDIVSCIRIGAKDFITKKNIKRLLPAIRRELKAGDFTNSTAQPEFSIDDFANSIHSETKEHKKTEARLLESEERYRALFEEAPNGIFLTTIEGKFLEVNTHYAQMLGYNSPQEIINSINNIGKELYLNPEDRQRIINKVKKNKGIIKAETYYRKKDGSVINARITLKSIPGSKNDNIRLIGYVEDITESKKTEKSSQLLAAIIESSEDAVYSVDLKNNIVTWNKAAENLFGFTKEEALRNKINIIMPQGYEKQLFNAFQKIKSGETIDHYETKRITKTGKVLDLSVRVSPVLDKKNKITGFSMIARNREEQMKAEATRRLLASIVESSDDAIISATLDKDILSWNKGAEKIYGYTENEVKGKNIKIVVPMDRQGEVEQIKTAIRKGERISNYETKRLTKSGDIIDVSLTISPLQNYAGEITGISIISRNITERKKFEEALRESEQRLRATFDNAALGIVEVDESDRFVAVNNRACSILGYKHEELLGKSLHDITFHEDQPVSKKLNSRLHRGELDLFDYEKRYIKKDGSPLWVHVSVSSIRDTNGKFVRAIGTFEDISERKKVEAEIKEANERFDNVLNMLPDPFFILDNEWKYVYVNNSACRQLKKTREELLGNVVWEVLPSMKRTERYHKLLKAAKERKSVKFTDYSHIIEKWYDYLVFPWNDGITLLMMDVTEKKQVEEALIEKEALIRDILESIQDVFYALDKEERFTYVNDKALEIWRKDRDELIGNVFSNIFPNTAGTETYYHLRDAMESRHPVHYEIFSPIIHSWIDVNIYPASDGGVTVYFRDISARKKIEEDLRQSESLIRDILNSLQDMFYVMDAEQRVIYVNQKALNHWKKNGNEIIGRKLTDIFPKLKNSYSYKQVMTSLNERKVVHYEDFSRITHNWQEVSVFPSANGGVTVYFRDITERKMSEIALRQSESFIRDIFNSIQDMFYSVDSKWRFTYINHKALESWDKTEDEVIGKVIWDIFPTAKNNESGKMIKKAMRTREVIHYETYSDVSRSWLEVSLYPASNGGLSVYYRDISERKKMEQTLVESQLHLQESQERFSKAFYQSPAALIIGRISDGTLIDVNDTFLKMFEYTREEVIGKKTTELSIYSSVEERDSIMKIFSEKGKLMNFERATKTKTGKIINILFSLETISLNGKPHSITTMIDITERKKAESALEEALKEANYNRALLEASFQAVQDGIVIFDMQGNVTFANEAEARINDYPSAVDMMKDLDYFSTIYELRNMDGSILQVEEWPVSRVLRGETINNVELTGIRKDTGREWHFSFSGGPVYDENRKQVLGVTITRDITDTKLNEKALLESERNFRALADNISQFAWMTDEKGSIFWYNKRWFEYTGTTLEEMSGWGWRKVQHPDYLENVVEKYSDSLAKGRFWEDIFPLRGSNGNYRWFLSRAVPIYDDNGKIINWFGTNTDITEQREIEQALRRREYVLAQAGMMAHLGAWDIDISRPDNLNDNPLRWSDEVYRIFGYKPGEVESSNELFFKHVHPDDRKKVTEAVDIALSNKMPYMIEHRIVRKDGAERIVLEHGEGVYDNIGRLISVVGAVQDITEQKTTEKYLIEAKSEAEARVKEAEEGKRILNALMEYIPEGITIADAPNAKIRYVSKQGQRLLGRRHSGLTAEEVADVWKVFHSDGVTPMDDKDLPLIRAIEKGEIIRNMEIVQINAKRKKLILLCNAAPIRDGNKSIIGGIVAWREISDIKKTEEMLRNSEERFRLALHNSPITVYFQDKNLKYIWIYNPQFGFKESEIIGRTDSDFFNKEDSEKMSNLKKGVITTGVTNRERISVEVNNVVQHFDIMVEPNYNKNNKIDGITCVSVNITEQVILEEDRKRQEISQLIEKSARLASVGVLAGGITHEINQPLNAIRVGAEGILFWNKRNQESLPPMIIDIIHGIASASSRIDEIIKSMRLFWVNTSKEALVPVDINLLVDRVVSLNTQKLTRHHVELKVKYHAYSFKIMANELQLELVLNNIIANAIQAVEKNKRIVKEINISTYITDNTGCLEIRDNGVGLPEVPMEKLFDPFFTTKAPNEGMGLGLAIVKSFLDKFSANIEAFNNESGGATFRIYFKLNEE